MLPSLAILLSLTTLLSPALGVPSPRRGGSIHVSSGGGGSDSGLALAALGGVIAANAENAYSIDGDSPPDITGYDATSTCTYKGGNATNAFAAFPSWTASMTGCLNNLSADNWAGNTCAPSTGGVTFGFWKGENDYGNPVDCYQRCVGCLSSAIDASQAVTTKCQYEYRTKALLHYKTHTCTMGYDKN